MHLLLDGVRVPGRRGPLLEFDALSIGTGECVLIAGDPGQGHTALALVLTGRLRPFSGRVGLVRDDRTSTAAGRDLRRATAVVDLPAVSEPDAALPVGTVVAEGLALARRGSWPGAARRWLATHGMATLAGRRIDALPVPTRTALLTALAAERPGVRFLVLTLPDRHGGEPRLWWEVAGRYAATGYGVLVQCGRSAARDLGAQLLPAQGGAEGQDMPVEALRVGPALATPQTAPTTLDWKGTRR